MERSLDDHIAIVDSIAQNCGKTAGTMITGGQLRSSLVKVNVPKNECKNLGLYYKGIGLFGEQDGQFVLTEAFETLLSIGADEQRRQLAALLSLEDFDAAEDSSPAPASQSDRGPQVFEEAPQDEDFVADDPQDAEIPQLDDDTLLSRRAQMDKIHSADAQQGIDLSDIDETLSSRGSLMDKKRTTDDPQSEDYTPPSYGAKPLRRREVKKFTKDAPSSDALLSQSSRGGAAQPPAPASSKPPLAPRSAAPVQPTGRRQDRNPVQEVLPPQAPNNMPRRPALSNRPVTRPAPVLNQNDPKPGQRPSLQERRAAGKQNIQRQMGRESSEPSIPKIPSVRVEENGVAVQIQLNIDVPSESDDEALRALGRRIRLILQEANLDESQVKVRIQTILHEAGLQDSDVSIGDAES